MVLTYKQASIVNQPVWHDLKITSVGMSWSEKKCEKGWGLALVAINHVSTVSKALRCVVIFQGSVQHVQLQLWRLCEKLDGLGIATSSDNRSIYKAKD